MDVRGGWTARWPPYSQEQTSSRLAAHATSSATVSAACTPSPDDLKVVSITAKTSGDSTRRVLDIIFVAIQNSFTTQAPRGKYQGQAHVRVSRGRPA